MTFSCLVQADPQLFDVETETSPVLSPAEARLGKVDGLKLAGGALAAGAGLAFLKNYWNKPATSNTYYKPANTYYKPATSNTYYKGGYRPYQYYHHNNQYPSYYHQPAALTYPAHYQQDQQFSQYKPSSVYYVKPYGGQPSQSMQYNNNNNNNQQQPGRYTYQQQQQQLQPQQQQSQVEDIDTEEMEQRIMEDEGLYSIGIIEMPQESRVIKKLLAGGAGLAAGYYLTNKYKEYKNNNKYHSLGYGGNKYFTSSSKPSYHYPAYHQSGYRPSYHHKYQQHQPAYPVYNQYQPSNRPPTYNRYQTSTSSSSRPTYYRAGDLQARSDSTCYPELVFSVGGNHLYKCRGQ